MIRPIGRSAARLATSLAAALFLSEAAAEPAGGPRIAAFELPRQSPTLSFKVSSLSASGNVAGYWITRSPIPPAAAEAGWSADPPGTITETEPGVYDYYAWVKDGRDRVSRFAEQTVDVAATRITVGPKDRDFTNFADALAAVAAKGNPKGVVIQADAGEYGSWRKDGGFPEDHLKNIIKVVADNLTIRGVGGRAHLAYKCRGATSKDRWTIPPGGPQHGSVIVQAARNLRLENVEVSGGCNANSMNGAGLWVEPGGLGTVIRNCNFHHNDNGILTSKIPGSRAIIMNSEFYQNGAPGPAPEGQNHNIYVGQIAELVFLFNYSHSSYRGQLLKSRAGKNHVLYNRLTDEHDSNYPIDLPYGGESYVIGNLVQMSKTNRSATFINYGREVVMEIVYRGGGPEPLKDRAQITHARTGKKHLLHYSFNYGATGAWENRDRANHCNMRITEADGPDFRPGDRLTYGQDSAIEVVSADWSWSDPRREIHVYSNTFVNECSTGYGQYLLRAHPDTQVARLQNNLIVDLKPAGNPYKLHPDASGTTKEKPVAEESNGWGTSDPGLADIAKHDYALLDSAAAAIDKGTTPGGVNGMSLGPVYQYVHPCSGQDRPEDEKLDLGAYELHKRPAERKGPLSGLPSQPGPHIARIKALGDDQWLDLGAAAADPTWGSSRGRSWCAQLDYAPDLRGAFHCGEGVHAFVKPDGHYMDDYFFYDINAHAWICVYPGAKAGENQGLRINEQGLFADEAGNIVPITPLSAHNYGMTAYDSDRGRLVIAPTEKVITHWGVVRLKQIEKLAPEASARLKGKVLSPWFLNAATGRFEREPAQCASAKDLPTTMGALAVYLPSIKKVFFRDRNWSTMSGNNWLYDPDTKSWDRAADGPARNIGGGMVLCYDSKRDRIYLPTAQTWYAYDVKADRWLDLKPKGGGRATDPNAHLLTYDATNDVVVLVSYREKDKNGMYIYDPAANAWLNDTPKAPPAGWLGEFPSISAFYDPVNNAHYYYRATDSSDQRLKFWVYRYKAVPPATTQPEPKAAAPPPPAADPLRAPAATQPAFRMNPELADLPDNTWRKMDPTFVYHPDQLAALEAAGRKPHHFCHFKGEGSLCYDPSANLTLYFGGCTSGYGNNHWVYDCSADTWTQIHPDTFKLNEKGLRYRQDPRALPPGCCCYGICYDSDRKVSLLVRSNGGATAWAGPEQPPNNLIWLYDAPGRKWIFTPQNGPVRPTVYLTGTRLAYDPVNKEALLVDGRTLWVYRTAENLWRRIDTEGPAPQTGGLNSWAYLARDRKFLLFRSPRGKDDPDGNTTWLFDPKQKTWENVTPQEGPCLRAGAAMAYDSLNNVAVMIGGWSEAPSKKLNDGTWVFDPARRTWTGLKPDPVPPIAGNVYQLAYDAVNNVFIYVTTEKSSAGFTWVYRYRNGKS